MTSRIGHTQKLVLQLLASSGACSARDLAYHWPSLTESAAHSALQRLGGRGLVDMASWKPSGGRTYKLTERGRDVERTLTGLATDEEPS